MFPHRLRTVCCGLLLAALAGCGDDLVTDPNAPSLVTPLTAPLPGAIFTTLEDGSRVNANIYQRKEDVFLDGGPGPNAPAGAAGLPAGEYFFQVTDPSGKDLLSTDHVSCRRIHVNEHGVIDVVYAGTNYVRAHGDWVPTTFQHDQGVDVDHSELGAITVRLFPYDNTPNRGGVYKVWITRVQDYAGDADFVPTRPSDAVNGENYQAGYYHGFLPAFSKTDNYKIRRGGNVDPPVLDLGKFHDRNLNCVQDAGEESIAGWRVEVTDPLGVANSYFTPASLLAPEPGTYVIVEEQRPGTLVTAARVDGAPISCHPTAGPTVDVLFAGTSREVHGVLFGNVGLGSLTACKIFDRNANGEADSGEPGVPGWRMQLEGTDLAGTSVGPILQTTGSDGCTTFAGLVPGTYTVTELIPSGGDWVPTGPTSQSFTIASSLEGGELSGTEASVAFTNVCLSEADFGTKGYWHNRNGLTELTSADVADVNARDPYDAPSSYFDDGDEPFNGLFSDGTPVEASMGESGDEIAPPGTSKAEISQFLVDPNAGGDPREQLAQQLLAFIFNVQHRLGGGSGIIELPDGSFALAVDLIDDAIAAWASGTPAQQSAVAGLLDALNNDDALPFVPLEPCEVRY